MYVAGRLMAFHYKEPPVGKTRWGPHPRGCPSLVTGWGWHCIFQLWRCEHTHVYICTSRMQGIVGRAWVEVILQRSAVGWSPNCVARRAVSNALRLAPRGLQYFQLVSSGDKNQITVAGCQCWVDSRVDKVWVDSRSPWNCPWTVKEGMDRYRTFELWLLFAHSSCSGMAIRATTNQS